jgi:hypothetical protein
MRKLAMSIAAVVGAACLYGAAITTRAQESPSAPFSKGDQVTFVYADGIARCLVSDLRGDFVKCSDGTNEDAMHAPRRVETWHNLATVRNVVKTVGR